MEIELKSAEFCLKENHPLSLRSAKGLHIICTDGTLWITLTGQTEDVFLTTSERYRVHGNGLVIVESLGQARFRLDTTNRHSFPPILEGFQRLLRNRDRQLS